VLVDEGTVHVRGGAVADRADACIVDRVWPPASRPYKSSRQRSVGSRRRENRAGQIGRRDAVELISIGPATVL